jgi:hypothetical protein
MKNFSSQTLFNESLKVDKEKGIIYGVKMVSEGEAKGHGVMLNKDFIKQTVKLGNAEKRGVKARFGHPNMCSTALGTYLGVYKNIRHVEGDQDHAIGDLYLSDTAKKTPNGNYYDYILDLADKEPDKFGSSIAFLGDEFEDKDIMFATIEQLFATDLVDSPAATEGLFDNTSLASRVTEFLNENEEIFKIIDKKPEIIEEFLTKYKNYTKMDLTKIKKKLLGALGFAEGDAIKEIQVVPLTGTGGTANINVNEIDYLATFADDLSTTADNFVAEHAEALDEKGLIVTSEAGKLTFTPKDAEQTHTITVSNLTPDLSGSVEKTTTESEDLSSKINAAVLEIKKDIDIDESELKAQAIEQYESEEIAMLTKKQETALKKIKDETTRLKAELDKFKKLADFDLLKDREEKTLFEKIEGMHDELSEMKASGLNVGHAGDPDLSKKIDERKKKYDKAANSMRKS